MDTPETTLQTEITELDAVKLQLASTKLDYARERITSIRLAVTQMQQDLVAAQTTLSAESARVKQVYALGPNDKVDFTTRKITRDATQP